MIVSEEFSDSDSDFLKIDNFGTYLYLILHE